MYIYIYIDVCIIGMCIYIYVYIYIYSVAIGAPFWLEGLPVKHGDFRNANGPWGGESWAIGGVAGTGERRNRGAVHKES